MDSLLLIGVCLSLGLVSSYICSWIKIPQVIGHILVGVGLGISGMRLFDLERIVQFESITSIALGLIGVMIGSELRWARLKRVGFSIILITFFETSLASFCVFVVTFLVTKHLLISLLLGALAAATAPGGTTHVLQEYRARGPLTTTLLGVIGADDAFAIVIYTIAFTIGKSFIVLQSSVDWVSIALHIGKDLGGALIIGIGCAVLFVGLMRFIRDNDARQLFGLCFVLCCTGLAIQLHCSVILANMCMGIVISNIRPHKAKPFFQILYKITPAIYILFFLLVGARLDIGLIANIGLIGLVYFCFRIAGKLSGAWLGATLAKANPTVKNNLGLCLLSQAGVAIGLAISADKELQIYEDLLYDGTHIGTILINIITATTFIFQIIGPMLTKYALVRAGETREKNVR